MGIGGQAGFDATLSDKAISAAISQLVENIINRCTDKPWKSYILSVEDGSYIISGGASQGLAVGDTFNVYLKGQVVQNPQTGVVPTFWMGEDCAYGYENFWINCLL